MAVDQSSIRSAPKAKSDTKFVEYDDYINTHIQSTRRAVKLIDLATSLVLLTTGVLAFLLAAAVAEHWFVPGGYSPAVRILLFALLVSSVAYFAYHQIWPLCWRAINPVYAAQTIEQSSPTLKNSLINFLLFRQRRSDISDAVYKTLEEQAAHRLTRVSLDGAVDRSILIRFGYVLIGVAAIAAIYKILSPKDPLVSAERVLMPWADIVPASRVSISDIKPGLVTVARGESLDISAEVRGIDDDDPVRLLFTTEDGLTVDKSIPMKLSSDGLRFEGRLPGDARGAENVGLTRNLRYRIEAGDARSLDYPVTVVAAPTLLVERIDYDYPAYTGNVDRQDVDVRDIRAIEGTRITIHARANDLIKEAHVDFDADGLRDLSMKANELKADASFELSLREDHRTPSHASYVLRFTNADGRSNRDPVKHSIQVDPDIAPEAAIVVPQEKAIDVRLDETISIEVDARDPDFALSMVRLRGEVAGRPVFDRPLLATEQRGKFTGKFAFTPSAHQLETGDVLDYWVEVNDNRTPKPNSATSERKRIRIASPDPNQQPPPNQIAQNDRQQQGEQPPQDQPQQQGDQKESGDGDSKGGQQQQGGKQQGGANAKAPPDGNEDKQNGEQQQGGSTADGESASADGKSQGQQGESKARQGNNDTGKQEGKNSEGGSADGKAGANDQGRENTSADKQNDQQDSSGKQTGAGAAGGESSKGESQPDGARPEKGGNTPQQQQPGDKQSGKQQQGEKTSGESQGAEQSPVSSEGDNDAEAFQRIREHMKRQGELKDDETQSSSENSEPGNNANQPFSRDAKRSADQQQGNKDTTRPEESNDATGQENKGQEPSDAKTGEKDAASSNEKPEPKTSDEMTKEATGESANNQSQGTDAKTRDDNSEQAKEPAGQKPDQGEALGGQETSIKGESGAGEEQKNQRAPNSQNELKPTEKREQSPSGDKQSKNEEPQSGAGGKKESDSQGEQGGDKAGGGEEGSGQKAPRDGTGSAGQNQSADEGAGESAEQGAGNNSPNAGKDAASEKPTGQSNDETKGRGSKTREGEGDKSGEQAAGGKPGSEDAPARSEEDPSKSGSQQPFSRDAKRSAQPEGGKSSNQEDKGTGKEGNNEQGKQGEQQPSPQGNQTPTGEPKGNNDASPDGKPGTATGSGGETGTGASEPQQLEGTVPDGDAANLEYARKQTDLVLQNLADQVNKKEVDEQLLKDLGWSEDDLRKFVARWRSRKSAAERDDASGEAARRELDDALRSLGLRRGTLQQGPARDDTMRDLREGYRGPVPSKYRDRLRAYNEGVSRARQSEE